MTIRVLVGTALLLVPWILAESGCRTPEAPRGAVPKGRELVAAQENGLQRSVERQSFVTATLARDRAGALSVRLTIPVTEVSSNAPPVAILSVHGVSTSSATVPDRQEMLAPLFPGQQVELPWSGDLTAPGLDPSLSHFALRVELVLPQTTEDPGFRQLEYSGSWPLPAPGEAAPVTLSRRESWSAREALVLGGIQEWQLASLRLWQPPVMGLLVFTPRKRVKISLSIPATDVPSGYQGQGQLALWGGSFASGVPPVTSAGMRSLLAPTPMLLEWHTSGLFPAYDESKSYYALYLEVTFEPSTAGRPCRRYWYSGVAKVDPSGQVARVQMATNFSRSREVTCPAP